MTESIHFSKENKTNQFEGVMYTLSDEGHPILHGSSVILECSGHSVHAVGDHHVWYGLVNKVSHDAPMDTPPLLYYARTYRSVGDDVFMDSFETARLAYEDWTHEVLGIWMDGWIGWIRWMDEWMDGMDGWTRWMDGLC
jgi:flavin reductase (DIM6/NTAB) family NADH-FMN oxidoreductase RutF